MNEQEKLILDKIDSMRDEIIKFHQKIVQIPSENPPGKYKEVAKFVKNAMEAIGLETQVKRHNVIGKMETAEHPSLILYGHMDTVEVFKGWTKDAFGGEINDDKIYGRGACDDKSCVTAEIFATKALLELGIKLSGKLTVVSVIDEEMGGIKGAGFLVNKGIISGDACLLGDGPGGYPGAYFGGALFPSIVITGKQAHGMSFPDVKTYRNEKSGVNAIHKMIRVLDFLNSLQEEFNSKETKYHNFPGHPSKISHINIGQIEGGTKISTVADKCIIQCGIHTIPEQNVETIKKKLEEFIETYKKEDPDLKINLTIPIAFEPQVMDINSDFAKAVQNSFETIHGEPREFKLFISTTDAHHFQEKGIITILAGAGTSETNIHAADEFIEIEDLINTTKIFALTTLNYLK
ncbi:MAG: M20 family metallopeptidase [Promethearchaeota archaeon]